VVPEPRFWLLGACIWGFGTLIGAVGDYWFWTTLPYHDVTKLIRDLDAYSAVACWVVGIGALVLGIGWLRYRGMPSLANAAPGGRYRASALLSVVLVLCATVCYVGGEIFWGALMAFYAVGGNISLPSWTNSVTSFTSGAGFVAAGVALYLSGPRREG
jgi:hypothetical protein